MFGCWGSRAFLRCVRLSPLAHSLSLDASLGRDLLAVQNQTLAATAELAQLQAPRSLRALEDVYQHSLAEGFSFTAGVLGKPSVR